MSEEPTLETSPDPPDHVGPEKRSAAPPSEKAATVSDERHGWRTRWKGRVARILPRRPSEPEDGMTSLVPGIILFLCLLGLAVLSILAITLPTPLPESAPADQYSAARAMTHIRALAARSHAVGTPAHAEAEAYLVDQLKQLGLGPQVQKTVGLSPDNLKDVTHVENVLARLRGSSSGGKAALLMAHYDSVPTGPGAADDASGCATLLETARALTTDDRPLANDVIFLFTDGEEEGAMGSEAFVREHPWAKDVGVALNVDCEGLIGRAVRINNVSPDNEWLISELTDAAPNAYATSFIPDFDRVFPPGGGDDFTTVFKPAGIPGFLASSDGGPIYHVSVLEDPAHVHLDSLQHQGTYALAFARRFGSLDLTVAHHGAAVYFNAVGNHLMVVYPTSWVLPLAIPAALAWACALVFGLRWGQVSPRGVLLGTLATLLVMGAMAATGSLLWRLVTAVYPQYTKWGGDIFNVHYYWLAFVALGLGLGALLHIGFRTRIRTAELAVGGLSVWLALAVIFTTWVPGASYVVTWPLLFAGIGVSGWFALRRRGSATAWRIGWLALYAIPAIALMVPLLYQGLYGPDFWIVLLFTGLLLGLLAPHLAIIARPWKWWLPVLMGVAAVSFLVAGHLTSAYTPQRPLPDGVTYALSADTGKAYWTSADELDPWTEQFFREADAGGDCSEIWPESYVTHKAPAPPADLAAPTVEVLPTTASGIFRLHIVPAPGTWSVYVCTLPKARPVTYYVNATPLKSDGWTAYWAPPSEGYNLSVKTRGKSLKLRVMAQTLGLPTTPGFTYKPRPDWIVPNEDYWANTTWVAKTFSLREE